jgi:glutamine amidotransferase
VHSFFAQPKNKKIIIASTEYFNISIPAIIKAENIIGFQFHPEKSGKKGLKLLDFFLNGNN